MRTRLAVVTLALLLTAGLGIAYADFSLNFAEVRFTTDPGTTITMFASGQKLWALPEVGDEVMCIKRPAGKDVFLEWETHTNLLLPAVQRQAKKPKNTRVRGRMQLGYRVGEAGKFVPLYRGPLRGVCTATPGTKGCSLEMTAILRDRATKNRVVTTLTSKEPVPLIFPSIGDILEVFTADIVMDGTDFCRR